MATKEDLDQLSKLAQPMIQWLNDKYHPHVTVIITPDRAELLEGIMSVPIPYFIKD